MAEMKKKEDKFVKDIELRAKQVKQLGEIMRRDISEDKLPAAEKIRMNLEVMRIEKDARKIFKEAKKIEEKE